MPISRIRRKNAFTPPQERAPARIGSPRWLVPLMLAFFLVGLVWIVAYYLSSGQVPIERIGAGNLAAGFGFIIVGFMLATQWR